jgi:hypothetical protein
MSEKKKKNWAKSLSEAINLVTTIAAAVGFCGYGGWWLDQKYGTGPKFTALVYQLVNELPPRGQLSQSDEMKWY